MMDGRAERMVGLRKAKLATLPRTSSSRQGQTDNSPPLLAVGHFGAIATQSRQGRQTARRRSTYVASDSIAVRRSKRLSSLRDCAPPPLLCPSDESLGYYQPSLAGRRGAVPTGTSRGSTAGLIPIPELDQELVAPPPLDGESRPRILRRSLSPLLPLLSSVQTSLEPLEKEV